MFIKMEYEIQKWGTVSGSLDFEGKFPCHVHHADATNAIVSMTKNLLSIASVQTMQRSCTPMHGNRLR